jgi:carbamoyl-phosphate synthase small subunit
VAQVNANDGTCEGIKYKKWNCFTVQFHPEANGGPKDTEFLFDRFLNNVKAAKKEAR